MSEKSESPLFDDEVSESTKHGEWLWRGRVGQQVVDIREDLRKGSDKIDKLSDKLIILQNQVTRLVVLSGVIAFVGSGVMSIIVAVIIKALSK